MSRLAVILGFVAICIVGSVFLPRRSAPVNITAASVAEAKQAAIESKETPNFHSDSTAPLEGPARGAQDLMSAFQLPEDEAYPKIVEIVEDWGALNPPAVFAALLRAPEGSLRHNAFIQLAAIWAETNPQAVVEAFKAQTDGDEQERGIAQAITTWAKNDPMAALDWVNQQNNILESRSPLRQQFYAAWASVEPEAAARYAITRQATPDEINSIFGSWANADLAAAVQFQNNELSPQAKTRARPTLLLAAASQNSPLSDSLLNDFLSSNPTREESLRIAKSLSSLQPRLAHAIADQLPAGPDTEALRNRIAALNPTLPQE